MVKRFFCFSFILQFGLVMWRGSQPQTVSLFNAHTRHWNHFGDCGWNVDKEQTCLNIHFNIWLVCLQWRGRRLSCQTVRMRTRIKLKHQVRAQLCALWAFLKFNFLFVLYLWLFLYLPVMFNYTAMLNCKMFLTTLYYIWYLYLP